MTVVLVWLACSGCWCDKLGDGCDDVDPRIEALLDHDLLAACRATADAGVEGTCTTEFDACAAECGLRAYAPAGGNAGLYGCWRQIGTDGARVCYSFEGQKHRYQWWEAGVAEPVAEGEFDELAERRKRGTVVWYNFAGPGTRRCAKVAVDGTAMFVSGIIDVIRDPCDPPNGGFVSRWEREESSR